MTHFRADNPFNLQLIPLAALVLLALSACLPTNPEPALSDQVAGEAPQEVVTVVRPTVATPATATVTAAATPSPFPLPSRTAVPHNELTTTPWPPDPPYTPTPAPSFPGMVYNSAGKLWQVDSNWQPQPLFDDPTAVLEPNGRRLLSVSEGDVWLTDLIRGTTINLTNTPRQAECCPQWWPGQPNNIFLGIEPGTDGRFLAQHDLTTNETSLLGPSQNQKSTTPLAAAHNGISFAFDLATQEAWVQMTTETTQFEFDPYAYGLPETLELRAIGAPAWSPDSQKLAWVMVLADTTAPDEPPAVVLGVFNLAQRQAQLLHPYRDFLGQDDWFSPPVWSPDGQWLAYELFSADPATHGLWVLAANGSSEHYIGGQNPIWSPDGRYLTYQNARGTQMTYPPEFVYKIGITLPPDATLREWQEGSSP